MANQVSDKKYTVYGLSQKIVFKNSDNSEEPVYVSGSVYLYGTDINLSLHCQDLYAYSTNDLTLDSLSNIERDVRLSAHKFNMYGTIGRNAFINVSDISLVNGDQKGFIQGNLSYTNHQAIDVPEDLVGGEITFNLKALDNTPTWLKNL